MARERMDVDARASFSGTGPQHLVTRIGGRRARAIIRDDTVEVAARSRRGLTHRDEVRRSLRAGDTRTPLVPVIWRAVHRVGRRGARTSKDRGPGSAITHQFTLPGFYVAPCLILRAARSERTHSKNHRHPGPTISNRFHLVVLPLSNLSVLERTVNREHTHRGPVGIVHLSRD